MRKRCDAAASLPAEPVAAFILEDWTHAVRGGTGPDRTGQDGTDPLSSFQFGVFFFLTDQIVETQRCDNTRCIFELKTQIQYKTVRKRQKKCKKGFLCSRSTTHRRHCIPGFSIKALEVSLFVYFTFSCKQLCDKCLQRVLKVRCALGVQRSAVTHFYIQSVFTLSCAILWARRRRRGGGAEEEDADPGM